MLCCMHNCFATREVKYFLCPIFNVSYSLELEKTWRYGINIPKILSKHRIESQIYGTQT